MDVSKLQKNKKSFLIKARAKGKITYTVNKGNKKYISVSKKGYELSLLLKEHLDKDSTIINV